MKFLSKICLLILVLSNKGLMHAMQPDERVMTRDERTSYRSLKYWPTTEALTEAVKKNNIADIRQLMSARIFDQADSREKFKVYVDLLSYAMYEGKMDAFKALLEGDRWHCLNKPVQWPDEFDDFYTVYDALRAQRFSQLRNDQPKFFATAVSYGAKSVSQLLEEGYVLPHKKVRPYEMPFGLDESGRIFLY